MDQNFYMIKGVRHHGYHRNEVLFLWFVSCNEKFGSIKSEVIIINLA